MENVHKPHNGNSIYLFVLCLFYYYAISKNCDKTAISFDFVHVSHFRIILWKVKHKSRFQCGMLDYLYQYVVRFYVNYWIKCSCYFTSLSTVSVSGIGNNALQKPFIVGSSSLVLFPDHVSRPSITFIFWCPLTLQLYLETICMGKVCLVTTWVDT